MALGLGLGLWWWGEVCQLVSGVRVRGLGVVEEGRG